MVDGVEMVFSKEKMIERLKKEGRGEAEVVVDYRKLYDIEQI